MGPTLSPNITGRGRGEKAAKDYDGGCKTKLNNNYLQITIYSEPVWGGAENPFGGPGGTEPERA